jgi:hypothetical protein
MERIRNSETRKQLETQRVLAEIKECQREWNNHVERLVLERFPRQTFIYHRIGRRDTGHPRIM